MTVERNAVGGTETALDLGADHCDTGPVGSVIANDLGYRPRADG